jgi:hypothetical protein
MFETIFDTELYFYYIVLSSLSIFSVLHYKRTKDLSRTLLINVTILFFISLFCSISLAHNYYQSLKPSTEGIGVSNIVAYWLLAEDIWAPAWTIELFKKVYLVSLWITFFLLCLLLILLFKKRKE